jgi:hypothetical protein
MADVRSGTDLLDMWSPRRANAASASERMPVLRIPVARKAPACDNMLSERIDVGTNANVNLDILLGRVGVFVNMTQTNVSIP